jgi:hypothetical protein
MWHTRCKCPPWVLRWNGLNPHHGEWIVDAILMIGILLLVLALLGVGGVLGALGNLAWVLLLLAVIVIAWRVITGRRPV